MRRSRRPVWAAARTPRGKGGSVRFRSVVVVSIASATVTAGVLAALFVAIAGSAFGATAAIPENDRFTACYQTSTDLLSRIVVLAEPNEPCPNTYARITWPAT